MKNRKQLSFDLDTSILKEIFGEDKYTKAYSDIKSFMKKITVNTLKVVYT